MKLYCLFDQIAEESGPIFECKNDAMAHRIYENLDMSQFPQGSKKSDFRLISMGFYHHGSDKDRPSVTAYTKPYDITNKIQEDEDETLQTHSA